jgi:hypothetical protein
MGARRERPGRQTAGGTADDGAGVAAEADEARADGAGIAAEADEARADGAGIAAEADEAGDAAAVDGADPAGRA